MKVVLVVALAALCSTSVFGSRVVVSISAIHLGASPAVVGGIMSLYFLPPVVLSMFLGRLVDRTALAVPMALAAVLLAVGHVLPAAYPSLWALAISAGCTGTAFVGAMIALSSGAAFSGRPKDRAANFSWFTLGTGSGIGAGPFLSGFALDNLGDAGASLSLVVWPLAMLLLIALAGRHLPVVTAASSPAASMKVAAPGRRHWLGLLRDGRLRAALVASVMGPTGYEVYLFVMPVHGTHIGLSPSTIGSMLGASAVTIVIVRIVLPFLIRWTREWTIMMLLFLALSVSYLLLSVVTQVWIFFAISIVMGIAQGLGQPIIMSMYFAASPEGRKGEAAGVRGIAQNTFSAGSPLLIGGLGAILGLGTVLVAASAIYAWGGWYAHQKRRTWDR